MPTLFEQIQTLLKAEKTQEALALFAQSGNEYAKMLQAQYDTAMEVKALGKVSPSEWQITINRICYALLEMTQPEAETKAQQEALKPPNSNADPALRAKLQNCIRTGDTPGAFQLMTEAGDKNGSILKTQWDAAHVQFQTGRMGFEEFTRVQNRVHYTILNPLADEVNDEDSSFMARMDALSESRSGQPFGPVPHARVKALIAENKTGEAIELCRNLGYEYLHLTARYKDLKKHFNLGLVSQEVWEQTLAQINNAIYALILEAPDGELDADSPVASEKNMPETAKPAKSGFWTKIRTIFE